MNTKPKTVRAVSAAAAIATIPSRQVIPHTKLFKASLQIAYDAANNALAGADQALAAAAGERDAMIELAKDRYEAIRVELDAERADIKTNLTGIEAAMAAIEPKASNVVTMAS